MAKTKHATDESKWAAARAYVNAQLETMKKFGSAPRLTTKAYDDLVQKVVKASS